MTNDRRFQQRYSAAPLKLTLRRQYWFGVKGREYPAIGHNFSRSGIAIFSSQRFKSGAKVLVSLESHDHRLAAIPADILRCEPTGRDYLCGLHFRFDHLPDHARIAVDTVLQRLQSSLMAAA
ncbi:PilZ domain-containing protein [Bacterioplanes sanyensis]|uniref:PilZ domain-containing protein n=1 Tax=Bacterioplanes sanyensis TaxID=1249553 RepID=UPI0012FE496C|nr:PilZ domain-containing protein [Bacterioplanes sanyensis]